MKIFDALLPSPWQEFCDEHVLAIRALDSTSPSIFETVRITRNPNDNETVIYRHDVIFIDDYLAEAAKETTARILRGHGYKDMDDFVFQTADRDDFVYDEQGNLDRENSPAYTLDLWLLASLIAESRYGYGQPDEGEFIMTEVDALTLLKATTGLDYKCTGGVAPDDHTSMLVRNALCRDCLHCCCGNGGEGFPDKEEHCCAAKLWDNIDPNFPAWTADCGRFHYEGFASRGNPVAPCFEVVERIPIAEGISELRPSGFIVVENLCGKLDSAVIETILGKIQEAPLAGEVCNHANLFLRRWDPKKTDFVDIG